MDSKVEEIRKLHASGHYERVADDALTTLLTQIDDLNAQLKKNEERGKEVVVQEVMVRLDAEEFGVLKQVAKPGEPMAYTLVRVLRESVSPKDMLLRFRVKSGDHRCRLFPEWMQLGPMSLNRATYQAGILLRQGIYEVEIHRVEEAEHPPSCPED